MTTVYGSKGYNVMRESLKAAHVLRSGGIAYADRVCGDTIRHIWGDWKQGGHVSGWIESKVLAPSLARFSVSHEIDDWVSQ